LLICTTWNFDFVVILCLYRNGQLFEYNHFKIISHYCFYINSSFILSYYIYHPKYVRHIFCINRILGSITSDVMNTATLSTWQYAPNYNKTRLKTLKMHPNFHLSYGILVRQYKNVMIMLQKERENPLKISFCFQTGDKIVIYVSTHGHWDCTTLQQHCTTFDFASGYTEVLQGGTVSMSTGRHVDNLYCFWTCLLFIEVQIPSQESEWSCIYVLEVSICTKPGKWVVMC
jgi:hypothetical protein